jgi:excisionase family DNA binding protein
MEDELLTVDEVARTLKVTRKAVYDLMRANRLPYVQIGLQRGRRIRRSVLESFLKSADRGMVGGGGKQYNPEDRRRARSSPALGNA